MFKEFLSHATQDSNVKTSLVFEHNYKGTDYEKFMTADSDEDALKIDVWNIKSYVKLDIF